MKEHDFEPVRGLPTALATNERVVWRGAPALRPLLQDAFHIRVLAAYFAVLVVAAVAARYSAGAPVTNALRAGAICGGASLFVLGLATAYAYGIARTTLYTLTSERLVLRVGVALSMTVTIPLSCIDAAAFRAHADGTGDLSLALGAGHRVSWMLLWPHARLVRRSRPEPVLRAIPDGAYVARLLGRVLAGEAGQSVTALPASAPRAPMPAEPVAV